MKVSVIIPTLNRGQALLDTLAFLLDQDMDGYEIIVVDQSPPYAEELATQLSAICNHTQINYIQESIRSLPHARNVGLRAARGSYIIFIDDDVEIEKDFVRQHYEFMEHYGVSAVAGRVMQENIPEVGALPIRFSRLARVEVAYLNSQVIREVDTFRGCNMAMRRDIFTVVGLFDVNYTGKAAREESDLALRLKKRGIPILLNPMASVLHLEAPNGGCRDMALVARLPAEQAAGLYKNDSFFFMKFFNHWLLVIYLVGLYKEDAFGMRFRKKHVVGSQMMVITAGVWRGVRLYSDLKKKGLLLT
jgi:GT2 family glycosyltransferase